MIRQPLPSDVDEFQGGMAAPSWNLPPLDLPDLQATIRLTVEVQGVVTPYNYGLLAAASGRACFWHIAILLQGSEPLMYEHVTAVCLPEGPVVPTGLQVLEVDLPLAELTDSEGPLAITIWTSGVYGPGASVDLLAGTPDSDSTLTIQRLQSPLDTVTLTH